MGCFGVLFLLLFHSVLACAYGVYTGSQQLMQDNMFKVKKLRRHNTVFCLFGRWKETSGKKSLL